jgi:Flp pilus assembly protein TadG
MYTGPPRSSRVYGRAARRGVAAVEFAVVAPVFFLLVAGVIEFGRAMMVESILANAAQRGARVGVLNGGQTADVSTTVDSDLATGGISGATTVVTPDPPSKAYAGQDVTVAVSIKFSQVSWLPLPWFLKNTTLKSTATLQRELGQ